MINFAIKIYDVRVEESNYTTLKGANLVPIRNALFNVASSYCMRISNPAGVKTGDRPDEETECKYRDDQLTDPREVLLTYPPVNPTASTGSRTTRIGVV
jgi:hypothetical protein